MNILPYYRREINYHPSHFSPTPPADAATAGPATTLGSEQVTGRRVRGTIPKTDDFTQPGERYRSFEPERQARFVKRIAALLGGPRVTPEIRAAWHTYLSAVDAGLGERVQEALSQAADS